MAIRVTYAPDLDVATQVGIDTGMGELRTQAQQLAQQEQMRMAALDEQARQFDMSAAMRTRSEGLQMQQQRAQLAARQQAAQQQAYMQAANQENELQKMYLAQEFGQDDMELQNDLLYGRQQAMSMDQQVADAFKEMRKVKYDGTGERLRTDFEAQFRQIQSSPLRPEQKAEVLGELWNDVEQADLSQYEQKPPTGYDDMQGWVPLQGQQLTPGQPPPPGYYYGQTGMRNNMPEYGTRYIPDPANPTGYQQLPDGSSVIIDPTSGQPTHIPAPKPAAAPKIVNEQEQIGEYVDSMAKAATMFKSMHTFDDDGKPVQIATPEQIMEFYDKIMQGYKKPGADGTSHRDMGAPRTDIPPEAGGMPPMGGLPDDATSPDGMIDQDTGQGDDTELREGEHYSYAADGTTAIIGADGHVRKVF